jgi:hypothetical protein
MKRKENWWAHRDSNPGQTDYEAVELGRNSLSKWKSRNEFSFSDMSGLAESELLPNLVGDDRFAELSKPKILNRFQSSNTEPKPIEGVLSWLSEEGWGILQN